MTAKKKSTAPLPEPRLPGGPIPMTQEEVEAMAVGGKKTRAIVRRLRDSTPPITASSKELRKSRPAKVDEDELRALARGKKAAKVRERLAATSASAAQVKSREALQTEAPQTTQKARPDRRPETD